MSSALKPWELAATGPEMAPVKKRRGVTLETAQGRALSFGLSQDRTRQILESMSARKYSEVTAIMQEHKAARLKKS